MNENASNCILMKATEEKKKKTLLYATKSNMHYIYIVHVNCHEWKHVLKTEKVVKIVVYASGNDWQAAFDKTHTHTL